MLGGCRVHILRRDFQFFPTVKSQDPLTLCSKKQEARGLHSVSAFFQKKRTSLKELLQDRTTSRLHVERTQPAWFTRQSQGNKEASEFNHEMLGGLSMRDPQGSSAKQLRIVGPGLAHGQKREEVQRLLHRI